VPQLYRHVLAMGILSVCLSVRLSRPGTDSRPGEIETPVSSFLRGDFCAAGWGDSPRTRASKRYPPT